MKIFKEVAGKISEKPCWCCISVPYLYTHDYFIGLLWVMITEWKEDKHLAL
jgi:hypothetical protein